MEADGFVDTFGGVRGDVKRASQIAGDGGGGDSGLLRYLSDGHGGSPYAVPSKSTVQVGVDFPIVAQNVPPVKCFAQINKYILELRLYKCFFGRVVLRKMRNKVIL